MHELRMPKPGLADVEMEILEVFIKVGDQIKIGDPILDFETEKISTTLESDVSGIVKKIFIKKGDYIKVGNMICTIDEKKQ